MASTRMIVGTVVTAAVLALGVACSSSSSGDGSSGSSGTGTSGGGTGTSGGGTGTSGGGGGTSGSGFKDCNTTSTTTKCTEAELKPYTDCFNEKCGAKYTECYGADYKTGKFSGPCGTFITCTNACACDDTACQGKCGSPDAACTTCLQSAGTCSQGCTVPACAGGGSSGSSGASGGGGGNKTCADLQACCNKIADAEKKGTCTQTYNAVKGSDPSCSAIYPTFAADCP